MTAMDQSKWEPTLQMSTDADINIATRENKQYEMKYKANYDGCIKRNKYTTTRSRSMPYCGRDV